MLLVLSGPSGAGKTTLAGRMLERHGPPRGRLVRSVSVTTRPPRPGEVEGLDYSFVGRQRFDALAASGALLEHAEVYGHRYGTPRAQVEAALGRSDDVLLVVDAQGVRQLARGFPADVVSVLVLPPSDGEARRRLRRSREAAAVDDRLAAAEGEAFDLREYHHVLVNRDLTASLERLEAILLAERRRHPPAG